MELQRDSGGSSRGNHGDGGASRAIRTKMDGLRPVTDHQSKRVMLAAERGDVIQIPEVIRSFRNDVEIPSRLTLYQRQATYYGPELRLMPEETDLKRNLLITSPGPNAYLHLWVGDGPEENERDEWLLLAEIKAELVSDSQFEFCSSCGDPLRSFEHKRKEELRLCADDS